MNAVAATGYSTRIEHGEPVAEGTMQFRMARPAGFAFKAGQAIDVVLPELLVKDAQDARHTFSIASAPFEDELMIATRMRDSAYKRALRALKPGAEVLIEGPFGSLTLHKDRARAAVLVAGGIGITPFMSMLRQAARDRSPQRLTLVYSNRRPEDAAFLEELMAMARAHASFRLVATMTQMAGSSRAWHGATGLIDPALMRSIGEGLAAPIYYLAGPPAMVAALRKTLADAEVDDDDVRSEEFYGY